MLLIIKSSMVLFNCQSIARNVQNIFHMKEIVQVNAIMLNRNCNFLARFKIKKYLCEYYDVASYFNLELQS